MGFKKTSKRKKFKKIKSLLESPYVRKVKIDDEGNRILCFPKNRAPVIQDFPSVEAANSYIEKLYEDNKKMRKKLFDKRKRPYVKKNRRMINDNRRND